MITPAESLFVGGYGAQTKTVYEFNGVSFMDAQNVSQDSVIRNITVIQIELSQKSMKQPAGKQIIFVRQGIRSLRNENTILRWTRKAILLSFSS